MRKAAAAIAILLAWTARGDEVTEARTHFNRGNTHYAVGEFADAAEEYQAAYKLKPQAAFLYDAAQAYRLAGNYEKALVLYRNFVIFYPNEAQVPEVQAHIAKLKAAVAARTSPPVGTTTPPDVPPTEKPPTTTSETPSTSPPRSNETPSTGATTTAAPELTATQAPPPKKRPRWLWGVVGGAAGLVVIGVTVGLVVGLSGTHYPHPSQTVTLQ